MNIQTDLLSLNHPKAIGAALDVLKSGGVIAFPTDTVYGIGVSAFHKEAIDKIFQVKGRSHLKAIPILITDAGELSKIADQINPGTERIINRFWPGALTLVLPKHPSLPVNLSPANTIGVRIPNNNLTRELLRRSGPLAATSANLSGKPSALTAIEVLDQLDGRIDLILDGGPAPGGIASTVLDMTGKKPKVLREGPISWEQLASIF